MARAKVVEMRTQAVTRYRNWLYLECGHIAFRNGPKPPKSVWCLGCNAENRDDPFSPGRWYPRWKEEAI